MSNQDHGSARKGRSQKATMFTASSQEKSTVKNISSTLNARSAESEAGRVAVMDEVALDERGLGTPCDCAWYI
jgi:hypothetical protein